MTITQYFTAQEAAQRLNIKIETLYAYVSRGLIRSEDTTGPKRNRRYLAEDVLHLQEKQEIRRNPTQVATKALHWGEPVLESALTHIEDGHLYYRGQDVVGLTRTHTFEAVADLLWDMPASWEDEALGLLPEATHFLPPHLTQLQTIERCQVYLPLLAEEDWRAYDLRPPALVQSGTHIVKAFAAIAGNQTSTEGSIATVLQHAWQLPEEAAPLLNTAFIVCADHELNISAFTARCVASAQATLYQVVQAGLSALQGARHGGVSAQVAAMMQTIAKPSHALKALSQRLRRGEKIAGFGHPLYPEGDPRSRLLLEVCAEHYGELPAFHQAQAVAEAAKQLIGEYPSLDFGLVTLVNVLGLPAEEALTLFALGRTVGWIAHALEQYQSDRLIRPRARYVGGS